MLWVLKRSVRLWVAAAVGASALACSTTSAAVLSGEAFDNGVGITVSPASSTSGSLTFTGSDSFFSVVGSAFGVPPAVDPNLQANALEITTASFTTPRTLRILITQTGLTSTATTFQVASTFNNLISSTTSATVSAFIDSANQPFAESTLLASTPYTSTSSTQASSAVAVSHLTPFSETFEFSLSFTGTTPAGSSLSTSEALTAVPEPTSIGLVSAGIAAVGLRRRRRA